MDWNLLVRAGWKIFAILSIPIFIIALVLVIHGSKGSSESQHLQMTADEGTDSNSKIWPRQKVPFLIDSLLADGGLLIKNSVKLIHSKTCIRFVEKESTDTEWIKFVRNDAVCFATVHGRHFLSTKSGQEVQLGLDCLTESNIQRVAGLVLGLQYEETRPDREKYIQYNPWRKECIERTHSTEDEDGNGTTLAISNEHLEASLNLPFDYVSHMFLTKECFQPLRWTSVRLGSSDEDAGVLSVLDLEKLNAIYKCSGCNSYRFMNIHAVISATKPFESFNPVNSGFDIDGLPLYVCRAYHQGSLLIGKMKMTREVLNCWIADQGREYVYGNSFEIMTNPEQYNFRWVDTGKTVLLNAIVGGRTNARETLYVGRCSIKNNSTTMSGSYLPRIGTMSVPFGSVAQLCPSFQLLTC